MMKRLHGVSDTPQPQQRSVVVATLRLTTRWPSQVEMKTKKLWLPGDLINAETYLAAAKV